VQFFVPALGLSKINIDFCAHNFSRSRAVQFLFDPVGFCEPWYGLRWQSPCRKEPSKEILEGHGHRAPLDTKFCDPGGVADFAESSRDLDSFAAHGHGPTGPLSDDIERSGSPDRGEYA
jgi:hypothetical protein